MAQLFTAKTVDQIFHHPHLLGHLMGKTKLTERHSEWIHHCWLNEEHNSILAHRGSYKTTAITEIGSMWWWLWQPGDRIGLFRKTYTEACNTLYTIKKHMETPIIRELFKFRNGTYPEFKIKRDDKLEFNFKTTATKEGNIDAHGILKPPTGTHYDKIITDDIITLEDRVSKAAREKTKTGIRELITNIIDPGKVMINAGTPWHKDDGWSILPEPLRCDVYETGILTEAQIEEKRSLTTSSLFAANYELIHAAQEDAIFKNPTRGPWHRHTGTKIFAQLDAKFSGDHWNGLTIFTRLDSGKIHIIGKAFNDNIKYKIDWVRQLLTDYGVTEIFVETNPDKGFVADALEANFPSWTVTRYHESMNKHVKITQFGLKYWHDIVFTDLCDDEYLQQVLDYAEKEEPDDAPDSMASGLREAYYDGESQDGLWNF